MSHYYLDSSAAVKLYVAETGANWLRQLLLGESPVAVTCHTCAPLVFAH
ncbi:MAG: hypothetical protein Fur0044_51890 [Anaerolineae bacterium]